MFIPFRLGKHIENLAFGIYGSPKIGHATVDLEVDLVQMPGGVGPGPTSAQDRCDPRSEMVHPAPNGLVGNRDAAFRQQILDVAEAEREPEIEPNSPLNDLRREPVTGIADFILSLANGWSAWPQAEYQCDNSSFIGQCQKTEKER